MPEYVKKSSKERAKLTQYYYRNEQEKEEDKKKLAKAKRCKKEIPQAEN